MTGIIQTKCGKRYVFRTDTFTEWIYAWDIYDLGSRQPVHRWLKMPAGIITVFDIDKPPQTVSYLPTLYL